MIVMVCHPYLSRNLIDREGPSLIENGKQLNRKFLSNPSEAGIFACRTELNRITESYHNFSFLAFGRDHVELQAQS